MGKCQKESQYWRVGQLGGEGESSPAVFDSSLLILPQSFSFVAMPPLRTFRHRSKDVGTFTIRSWLIGWFSKAQTTLDFHLSSLKVKIF